MNPFDKIAQAIERLKAVEDRIITKWENQMENQMKEPQYSDNHKPICRGPLDGNVYVVIGRVVQTIRAAGYPAAATECKERCLHSNSYEEVLAICSEYVEFDL